MECPSNGSEGNAGCLCNCSVGRIRKFRLAQQCENDAKSGRCATLCIWNVRVGSSLSLDEHKETGSINECISCRIHELQAEAFSADRGQLSREIGRDEQAAVCVWFELLLGRGKCNRAVKSHFCLDDKLDPCPIGELHGDKSIGSGIKHDPRLVLGNFCL